MYFAEGGRACMNITHENSFYVNYIGFEYAESLSDLGDGCRIEFMYLTSWPLENGGNPGNVSCSDIRRMMFYGFEFSWLNSFCKDGWSAYLDKNSNLSCVSSSSGNLLQTTFSKLFLFFSFCFL
jgi:hypothetical protein